MSTLERRLFIKKISLLGAATTVAVTLPQTLIAEEQPAQTVQTNGYHVTDHIRAYYDTLVDS